MPMKINKSDVAKYAVIGASLAGLAAAAYFFLGPKGKIHRQHTKAWAIKMKADVIEKLETAHQITEPIYHGIIDSVANDYKKGKKASQPEIDAIANDLKKHWKSISKLATSAKQEVGKNVSRVAKTVKKTRRKKK
jgi:hypothetical protein